jgi:hypothetical protein
MPATFDGPARAIEPADPDPPAEVAPPLKVGWLARTYCRMAGTPVTGRTPTSGAFVSGCASAVATSPASRSTRGVRSGMSQPAGASRSAGVPGAARLSHASCIDGARGSMSVRTTASSCSASSTPAVAAARRSIPVGLTRLEPPGPGLRKADAIAEFAPFLRQLIGSAPRPRRPVRPKVGQMRPRRAQRMARSARHASDHHKRASLRRIPAEPMTRSQGQVPMPWGPTHLVPGLSGVSA